MRRERESRGTVFPVSWKQDESFIDGPGMYLTMTGSEDSVRDDVGYTFVCPECGESMQVNASMKEALIENGCVVCSASVPPDSFTAR